MKLKNKCLLIKKLNLKTFFYSFYKNRPAGAIFTALTVITMDLDWWPFYVVIVLFVLAIISPWVFPNDKVSDNEHDNRF